MSVLISNIAGHLGEEVQLKGWVSGFRSSGGIHFIELRDGSGFLQCIGNVAEVSETVGTVLKSLTIESSIVVTGLVTQHPKRANVYELQVRDLTLIHHSKDYPLGRKDHGPDFLLDNRHVWLRSKKQWAIQRIRNSIINATYSFFAKENFIKIDAPIITSTACEGTTTLFELPYFDLGKGYLSQSGQLYLESAIAAHGRVFDFGPVFRAERSKTRVNIRTKKVSPDYSLA